VHFPVKQISFHNKNKTKKAINDTALSFARKQITESQLEGMHGNAQPA